MEENQNGMNRDDAPRTYGEESRMYENGGQPQNQPGSGAQSGYGQMQSYGGQLGYNSTQGYPSGYDPYQQQPVHGPVTDVFCYVLLAILPLRVILGFFLVSVTYGGLDSESIIDGSYMANMMSSSYMTLSLISNLLLVAMIVFFVLDILRVHKENYKITGLILFAIFLKPGYYIWRAYVLGRKKTLPIVYTVIFALLQLGYYAYSFYMSFYMIGQMVESMY